MKRSSALPENTVADPAPQLAVNPLKGGVLIDLYKPVAAEDRTGQGMDRTAAYGADHLAAVLSVKNLKIAMAAVAAWERG
jgi:hypothetical protein